MLNHIPKLALCLLAFSFAAAALEANAQDDTTEGASDSAEFNLDFDTSEYDNFGEDDFDNGPTEEEIAQGDRILWLIGGGVLVGTILLIGGFVAYRRSKRTPPPAA